MKVLHIIIVLLAMIFLHIKYDFNQGIVAYLKQKSWYKKNGYTSYMYRRDHIIGLFTHSIMWAIYIQIPPLVYELFYNYSEKKIIASLIVFILVNTFVHATVDDQKANKKNISLFTDQVIHYMQILLTWSEITLFL